MGKHRDRMEQDLVMRGFSRASCESYVRYAKAFVSHFGRSADELGTEHVRKWVLWLLTVRKLDAATVNVAIAALRFLFSTTLERPEVMLGSVAFASVTALRTCSAAARSSDCCRRA